MSDEQIAESSTATIEAPEAPEAPEARPMESWSDVERHEWLKTGETPKPKAEGSAPPTSETPPASETGRQEQQETVPPEKPRTQNAETRKRQLGAEIQDLLEQRRQLRSEMEAARRGDGQVAPPTSPRQASQAEGRPTRPKIDAFDSYETYETALDDYEEKLADWKVGQRIDAERHAYMRQQQVQEIQATNQQIKTSWEKRLSATKARHADFDEVIAAGDLPLNPIMDGFILESEIGPDLVYHLAHNPTVAEKIAALGPYATARELTRLEADLSEKLKSPTVRTITGAKPPPTMLAGATTAPDDEVGAAVAAGDFARYRTAANARDKR